MKQTNLTSGTLVTKTSFFLAALLSICETVTRNCPVLSDESLEVDHTIVAIESFCMLTFRICSFSTLSISKSNNRTSYKKVKTKLVYHKRILQKLTYNISSKTNFLSVTTLRRFGYA